MHIDSPFLFYFLGWGVACLLKVHSHLQFGKTKSYPDEWRIWSRDQNHLVGALTEWNTVHVQGRPAVGQPALFEISRESRGNLFRMRWLPFHPVVLTLVSHSWIFLRYPILRLKCCFFDVLIASLTATTSNQSPESPWHRNVYCDPVWFQENMGWCRVLQSVRACFGPSSPWGVIAVSRTTPDENHGGPSPGCRTVWRGRQMARIRTI